MTLDQYLSSISSAYKLGIATELHETRIPNLTPEIINKIANNTGLIFILTKDPEGNVCMINNKEIRPEFRQNFVPIDVLNYAYAVLHSSKYRSTGKELLQTNFPCPKNAELFWKLSELGSKIKEIHSIESPNTEDFMNYHQKIKSALSETAKLIKKIDKIKTD